MSLSPVPVLLVDDRQENLFALKSLLADPELDVVLAASGDEALRQMVRKDFAVVLLDVHMPNMDGFETAVTMRSVQQTRYVPIILVSAVWKAPPQVFKGYESGAVDYLTKPIEPAILKSKVRIFVDLYRQRRRAEDAVRDAEEARRRLTRSEKKLRRALAEAEKANEAKTMFLAHMSHELRTPMNAVVAFSSLLRETGLSPSQEKLVAGICQGSEILLATIDDILDVSKVQAGEIELESLPFDLRELVQGTVLLVSLRAEEKGLRLRYEVSEDTPQRLRGDPTRLRQILLNLLSNAVKFTDDGEVGLVVSTRPLGGRYEITATVTDTGVGIPSGRVQGLFAPFSQADVSTTRKYGGTGLGLTLVKRLAELMEGDVEVESEVGKGSRFCCRVVVDQQDDELPASDVLGDTASGDTASGDTAPAKGRAGLPDDRRELSVLLVEDDELNQVVAEVVLQSIGLGHRLATDGAEAVRMVEAERFDVILMDVHMPHLDGLEATRRIRRLPNGETAWIVGMSANVLASDREKCFAAGMDAFVGKPILPDVLASALGRVPRDKAAPPTDAAAPTDSG